MAYLSGYSKYKVLTLTGGASGAQTNFQLKIAVSYEAAMDGEFDDIRFTQSDGTTLVDAWAEVIVTDTSATVWVEFPTTPANTVEQTYYMYYGNAAAVSDWDGAATFLHFDDFPGSSVDTGKWSTNGTPSVSGGILTCDSDGEYVKSLTTWNQNVAHRFNAKFYGDTYPWGGFRDGTSTPLAIIIGDYPNATDCSLYTYVSSANPTDMGDYLDSFYTFEIEWISGEVKSYVDDILKATHTTQIPSSALPVEFLSYSAGLVQVDWSAVMKHVANPPTYAFGAEQSVPTAGNPYWYYNLLKRRN